MNSLKMGILRYSRVMRTHQPHKQIKPVALILWIFGTLSTCAYGQSNTPTALYQRSLAATCANCHGTDGKGAPNGGMPLINHLSKKQMLEQLLAYKAGTKAGTIMPQLCKGYTDEQLAAIAQELGSHE